MTYDYLELTNIVDVCSYQDTRGNWFRDNFSKDGVFKVRTINSLTFFYKDAKVGLKINLTDGVFQETNSLT